MNGVPLKRVQRKWEPVLRLDTRQNKDLEQGGDSKENHLALEAEALRHKQKMEKRKPAQDAEVASKTITQKGLLIVHTGKGKGKSTAAFGLLLRALGHEWPCGVVQFVKGAWDTGERRALARFSDLVSWHT